MRVVNLVEKEYGRTKMEMTIWLVGKINPENKTWDIIDIFIRELEAIEACGSSNYFIVELATIGNLPEDLDEFTDIYFPFEELAEGC